MSGFSGRLFASLIAAGMAVTFFMLANVSGGVLAGFGYGFGTLCLLSAVMSLFGRVERRK